VRDVCEKTLKLYSKSCAKGQSYIDTEQQAEHKETVGILVLHSPDFVNTALCGMYRAQCKDANIEILSDRLWRQHTRQRCTCEKLHCKS
jgi:hypothetical protein